MQTPSSQRANRRLGMTLAAVVVGMVGMAYASVPLYNLFCRVTGYGGTTQRADAAPGAAGERTFVIRFNADVSPDLDWGFRPEAHEVTVRVGEEKLAFYRAVNNGYEPVVGTAVYNVSPQKVGAYFNKVQCFCFEQQILKPGEEMDFPVSFFVDPEIIDDRNLDDVKIITLSYTFFPDRDAEAADRRAALSQ